MWLLGQPISLLCSLQCSPLRVDCLTPQGGRLQPHPGTCLGNLSKWSRGPGEEGEIYTTRVLLCAKGVESSLSLTQAPHLSPPPLPFLCPLSCKLPSAGDWGVLVYEFPSLSSPLPHTHAHAQHNLCLSSLCRCSRASRPLGAGAAGL